MKILVTGASGFLGRAFCQGLAQRGHEIVGLDVAIPEVKIRYRQIQCDLLTIDLNEILASERPQQIVHCAGNANVGLSIQDPLMDLNSSYVLLHRLLYAVKETVPTCHLLFLSSAAVYGNPRILPVKEAAARRPISPYGLHKAACEDLLAYFSREENVDCRTLRIFSAYGAGLRKQILWDLCNKMRAHGPIEMFGTGSETRDFIHVQDVVQAGCLVMEKGAQGIYNAANGCETRIEDLAKGLLEVAEQPLSRLRFNGKVKAGDPLNWRADISRLQALGYRQSIPLKDGLAEYCRWRKRLG